MSNGLDVALMKDPDEDWSPENGDRHLDIAFSDPEWDSFFFNTLNAAQTKYIEGEPYEVFDKRRRIAFHESLNGYPMLSRIDEFYQDVSFGANEIHLLRDELKRVEKLTLDNDAKVFLDGMLAACEAAASLKMGIRLLSS